MDAFGTILIAVSVLAVLVAAVSYWGSGRIYSGLGRGDLEPEEWVEAVRLAREREDAS